MTQKDGYQCFGGELYIDKPRTILSFTFLHYVTSVPVTKTKPSPFSWCLEPHKESFLRQYLRLTTLVQWSGSIIANPGLAPNPH